MIYRELFENRVDKEKGNEREFIKVGYMGNE
jgi:hypothetical protein